MSGAVSKGASSTSAPSAISPAWDHTTAASTWGTSTMGLLREGLRRDQHLRARGEREEQQQPALEPAQLRIRRRAEPACPGGGLRLGGASLC